MGKRGPAPKPTALRILDGDEPYLINHHEPVPRDATPEPPSWIGREERKIWDYTLNELKAMRLVTAIDRDALASYCVWTVRFVSALRIVRRDGIETVTSNGSPVRHPAAIMLKEASQMMVKYAAEFGLTPAARTQIRLKPGEGQGELERLLS